MIQKEDSDTEGGLTGITSKAKGIPGYHHILSFAEGPRMCLGKFFAVAEFKVRSHKSEHKLFFNSLIFVLCCLPGCHVRPYQELRILFSRRA